MVASLAMDLGGLRVRHLELISPAADLTANGVIGFRRYGEVPRRLAIDGVCRLGRMGRFTRLPFDLAGISTVDLELNGKWGEPDDTGLWTLAGTVTGQYRLDRGPAAGGLQHPRRGGQRRADRAPFRYRPLRGPLPRGRKPHAAQYPGGAGGHSGTGQAGPASDPALARPGGGVAGGTGQRPGGRDGAGAQLDRPGGRGGPGGGSRGEEGYPAPHGPAHRARPDLLPRVPAGHSISRTVRSPSVRLPSS